MTSTTQSRVAVITGSAGGIGLGMAKACAADGMRVMLADLDPGRLAEAAEALKNDGAIVAHQACDVRDAVAVEALRDVTLAQFGQIDLVCNNAGIGLTKQITQCSAADWNLLLDINVGGVVNGLQAFLPVLTDQGHGHISATASLSGLVGDPDLVIYNASKFAVVGMMEATALELHRDHPGVGVSVLCPGPVATELLATSEKAMADAGTPAETNEDVAAYLASGLHPDAVGRMAIDGINAGDFWLLPHPEMTFGLLEPRMQAMQSGKLFVPDTEWTLT